ncbi:hypothetical protein Glove_232g43 [Diversispora epigaea]|uniref:Uncharacterized protein n=1 Tax=Diversispora epigaea TaxID=1348612 RepID=A0A397IBD6_9GLOM|nr:hypothetical protein Glove_232g43 [Diversispora epigaea]
MKEKDNLEVEESDITDSEIDQEILDTMELGVHRNAKDILCYIIPNLHLIHYHHNPDYHYAVALYPGTEKYNTIKFILEPFVEELHFLKEDELEITGVLWKIKLYFSSDWKFLAICLGLNSVNSKYFANGVCAQKMKLEI